MAASIPIQITSNSSAAGGSFLTILTTSGEAIDVGTAISTEAGTNPVFTGNVTQTGAGTFSTGTGTNSLNGNVVIATGKKLTVSMTTALDADYTAVFGTPFVSSIGANNSAFGFVALSNYVGTVGGRIVGAHTRSTGTDANVIVANNDELARFSSYGADGAAYQEAGYMAFEVDGAPSAGDMPGRWKLFVTPDGSATPGLAITVDNTKLATFAGDIASNGNIALADAKNISLNATTGSKIGTAVSQKLGFWNVTPVVQPSGAAQVAPAAYITGGFGLDSDVNMHALYDLVVAMRTALVAAGIMKGAA